MTRHAEPETTEPRWEALRPDDVTRGRLRRAIEARARPLLEARRLPSWHDVAAGWASMLVPVAAVLAVFFGALAYRAVPGDDVVTAGEPTMVEELLLVDDQAPPAVLTAGDEPTKEGALTAVMAWREGPPGTPEPSEAQPQPPQRRP